MVAAEVAGNGPAAPPPAAPPPAGEAFRVWARIGMLSFGGPAGQIALMHRELVERRRWLSEHRFLHALNYCMLLPGPEAQQLATYIGWLLHGSRGGLAAGLLFILPGALVMLALAILYARFRHLPLVDELFFGVKAAVLAVVVEAVLRIGRRALRSPALLAVAAIAFLAIFLLDLPFPLIVLAAGLAGWLGAKLRPQAFAVSGHALPGKDGTTQEDGLVDALFAQGALAHAIPSPRRALLVLAAWLPLWLGPVLLLWLLLGAGSLWPQLGAFFSVLATVSFGGAYAVLGYVAQAAVEGYGWLSAGEMLDGLGLAETTPGPLILVLQFVAFLTAYRAAGPLDPLLAGGLGALLCLWTTFAPCFMWIFLGGPYVEALRQNRRLSAALAAITASVVGVIVNLALWFALHLLFHEVRPLRAYGLGLDLPVLASLDWRAALLAAAAMLAMLRFRVGMLPTLAGCAAAGLLLLRLTG